MESLIENLVWSGHWRNVRFQNAELGRNPWKVGRVCVHCCQVPVILPGLQNLQQDIDDCTVIIRLALQADLYFQKEIRWDSRSPDRNPRGHRNLQQGGTREKETSIVFICILTWQSRISGFCWEIESLLSPNPLYVCCLFFIYGIHFMSMSSSLDCELILIVIHFKCPCRWNCHISMRSSMNVCQIEI